MSQEVKIINLKDLVLWTENPRDPFNENASDQEIACKAFDDTQGKWSLKKLAKEMGNIMILANCQLLYTIMKNR